MNELILWLISMETSAGSFYKFAAQEFSHDPELSEFLNTLAADEIRHYEIITQVAEHIKTLPDFSYFMTVNQKKQDELIGYLFKCRQDLNEKKIDEQKLLYCIARVEFSEWNYVFIYAVAALKNYSKQFLPKVADMDHHKKSIERFLKARSNSPQLLEEFIKLPKFLDVNLLIVEDSEPASELLKAVLAEEGNIEVATSAHQALLMLPSKYYSAIISSIETTLTEEVDFYCRLEEKYPGINKRLIFFSSNTDTSRINVFDRHKINYITKPAPIGEIRKQVAQILDKRSE